MRDVAGSAAAPAARCRNCRRGSFILNLPFHVAQSPRWRSRLWPLCAHAPGRRTVNTEPLPGSLFTVTSPPIMRASLRVIEALPRPPQHHAHGALYRAALRPLRWLLGGLTESDAL